MKGEVFNKQCWENWIYTCTSMKLDPYFLQLTIINLKWIKDLNIRLETTKLLQENIEENPLDISFGNDFFFFFNIDMKPKTQETKMKLKWPWG